MTGSTILDTLNSKSISGGNMNTTYARFRLQDIPIDKIYSNDKNSESIEPFKTCSMEALLNAKLPCAAPSSSV